jgi:uncharacterized membrane protein YedE/YeeE
MEDKNSTLDSLLERAEEYGKTSLELIKLKTIDKTADVISSFVPFLLIGFVVFGFFIFLNLGIALWLGHLLGSSYDGFFLVAAFYGFIGLLINAFLRKWIKSVVGNFFIKQVLKNDSWEE